VTARDRGVASDAPVLVQARRRIALLVTGAILLGVLLASGVTWVSVMRERDASTEAMLRSAALSADDTDEAPLGISLFIRRPDGTVAHSSGAPQSMPDTSLMDQAGEGVTVRTVHRLDDEYLTATARHNGRVVQAVSDLRGREAEQRRLIFGLGLASLLGLGLALVAGRLLARRATRPLEEALARQRRFVADASHELRTPLTRLSLRAELLARELDATPSSTARKDASQLLSDAREMSGVLSDLLLSAQLRAGTAPGDDIDVTELVAQAVAADRLRAEQAGVTLTLDAPEPYERIEVHGSRTALRRALGALLDNALAHTPAGATITVRVGREGTWARIDVIDTGEGFDARRLPELLRPFRRGHDDHRRFGLGLALVSDVLEAHGGTLGAESSPGEGAHWTVRLPLAGSSAPTGRGQT
jgi:two-component system, OmpR family, sensor kinase